MVLRRRKLFYTDFTDGELNSVYLEQKAMEGCSNLSSIDTKHSDPSAVDEGLQGGEAEHRHKVVAGVAEKVETVSPGGGLAGESTKHLLNLLLPAVSCVRAKELFKQCLQGAQVGGELHHDGGAPPL